MLVKLIYNFLGVVILTNEKALVSNIQGYLLQTCGKCIECDRYNCKLYGVRKIIARDDLIKELDISEYFILNDNLEQQVALW